ncbi:CHAT domain-containing protein [Cronbergia sp. UHCC 0137]|uniref:CHAT domain-containing protein n=1 Tax=Cronbergia sp. UHCC 0137 TaxID=3110239 RepID=UPI002B208AD1|nr:CHAT domain-containing protein [Cronbergia sp. UHCC 0137]MEA5620651.1 CHAT domain-containing protein [Cronbergia sp. UHCC 0137]
MNKSKEILEAQCLLQKGYFQKVIELLNSVDKFSPNYGFAQILKLRCLLEQGKIRVAGELLESVEQDSMDKENRTRFELWSGFVSLYGVLKKLSFDRWTNLEKVCSDVLSDTVKSPSLKALALDLDARLKAWKISLGYDSPCVRNAAIEQMGQAVGIYNQIGEHKESMAAKRRQAQFCCHKPLSNRSLARQLFEELRDEAHLIGDLVTEAEACLSLAEMDFDEAYANTNTDNRFENLIGSFEEAAQLFVKGGHIFGEAKVVLIFGELLLKYGCEDGVNLVLQAIEELASKDEIVLRQGAWRNLNIWHTHHGNFKQAREALRESEQLSVNMQFDLSQGIDWLGQADYAFRRGDISRAREILSQSIALLENTSLGIAYRQIMATITSSIGLFDEAEQLLTEITYKLKQHGPSSSLADTWFILGNQLLTRDYSRSMYCMEQAIQIDQQLNDASSEAHHIFEKVWMQAQYRRITSQSPLITEEIELGFDQARDILLLDRTLEGQIQLGSLCDRRGQIYFFAKDWQRCGTWLTLAEELFREFKLLPSLAFTLSYQGLVLIELGRTAGIQMYEEAQKRLQESQEILEEIGLQGVIWRSLFFLGLCEYEAGRLELPNSDQQKKRWERANNFLDKAARKIDQLRGFSENRYGIHQQNTWISFGVDKRTVYDTGFQLAWFWQNNCKMALTWLERMKSRALLDALAEITLPSSQISEHKLIQQEQVLLNQKQNAVDVEEAIQLQEQLDSLFKLMSQSSETKDYAFLRSGEIPTWEQVQETLQREQLIISNRRFLVIEYYCTPHYTIVFGMCAEWTEPKVESIQIDYQALANFVKLHFRQPDGVRMMIEDIGELPWHKFSSLLSPLLKWSEPNDIVCLIPYGIIHDLPLHTLVIEDHYLIDRNPVFYCPSISVLQYLLQRDYSVHQVKQRNFTGAVFGDSRCNLPRSRDEALAVAELMQTTPHLGESVTRQNFLLALKCADILHFAGHSELSASDGFNSGLYLADGDLLRASELFSLSTRTDLVVLSGCETGVSEQRTGDELVGLVRSFLYAGTNTLLVSQWRVNDESTKDLLNNFYLYAFGENTLSKAESLQKAIKKVRSNSCWQSFYHWGGFVLIGDWK